VRYKKQPRFSFDREALLQGSVSTAQDRLAGLRHGHRRIRGDAPREIFDDWTEGRRGNHAIHETNSQRFCCIHLSTGQYQLESEAAAQEPNKPLRPTPARQEPKPNLRQAEDGGVRRDTNVRGECELCSATQGQPIDRGDYRFRHALHPKGEALTGVNERGCLVEGKVAHFADVAPCYESAIAGSGQNDDPNSWIRIKGFKRGLEFPQGRRVDRIESIRPVDGECRNAARGVRRATNQRLGHQ
jgi:hypothetical protein